MKGKFAQYFDVVRIAGGGVAIMRLKPCPPAIEQEFIQKLKSYFDTNYPHYKIDKVSESQMQQLAKERIAKGRNNDRNN